MPHSVHVVPKTSLAVRYAGGYAAKEELMSKAPRDSSVDSILMEWGFVKCLRRVF